MYVDESWKELLTFLEKTFLCCGFMSRSSTTSKWVDTMTFLGVVFFKIIFMVSFVEILNTSPTS